MAKKEKYDKQTKNGKPFVKTKKNGHDIYMYFEREGITDAYVDEKLKKIKGKS